MGYGLRCYGLVYGPEDAACSMWHGSIWGMAYCGLSVGRSRPAMDDDDESKYEVLNKTIQNGLRFTKKGGIFVFRITASRPNGPANPCLPLSHWLKIRQAGFLPKKPFT